MPITITSRTVYGRGNGACKHCGGHIWYDDKYVSKRSRWFGDCRKSCPKGRHMHKYQECAHCDAKSMRVEEIEDAEEIG